MVYSSSSYSTSLSIASFYNSNKTQLHQSLLRLTSGKKVMRPSDDIGSYVRSQNLKLQYNNYEPIKENLNDWLDTLDVAEDAADAVYDNLTRMKELINLRNQTTDTDLQDAYHTEFDQLADTINTTISKTSYNGYTLLAPSSDPMATIYLSPSDTTNTISVSLPDVILDDADPSDHLSEIVADDISSTGDAAEALTNVNNAIDDVQDYLSKVSGYKYSVQSQLNIVDSIMQNTKSAEENLTNVDEVSEIVNYTALDIRQQAATAMLAQANSSSRRVLMLYGFAA